MVAFLPNPDNAAGPFISTIQNACSQRLGYRWREWKDVYLQLEIRNPRLRLRNLMQDISESKSASSWPTGYEYNIWRWADGETSQDSPFYFTQTSIEGLWKTGTSRSWREFPQSYTAVMIQLPYGFDWSHVENSASFARSDFAKQIKLLPPDPVLELWLAGTNPSP